MNIGLLIAAIAGIGLWALSKKASAQSLPTSVQTATAVKSLPSTAKTVVVSSKPTTTTAAKSSPTPTPVKTVVVTAAPVKTTTSSTTKPKVTATPVTLKSSSPPTTVQRPIATAVLSTSAARTATVQTAKVSTGTSSQISAANNLDAYLRTGAFDRTRVKQYQAAMGNISADGVAGPKTEARAEQLLNKDVKWPGIEAGRALYDYYVKKKGRDKNTIKKYQKAMGELTVDGIVGSKTKARTKSLTGINWT